MSRKCNWFTPKEIAYLIRLQEVKFQVNLGVFYTGGDTIGGEYVYPCTGAAGYDYLIRCWDLWRIGDGLFLGAGNIVGDCGFFEQGDFYATLDCGSFTQGAPYRPTCVTYQVDRDNSGNWMPIDFEMLELLRFVFITVFGYMNDFNQLQFNYSKAGAQHPAPSRAETPWQIEEIARIRLAFLKDVMGTGGYPNYGSPQGVKEFVLRKRTYCR